MSGSLFDAANGWINQQLASATGASSFALLLLAGALASLLPCVYPLYPITAGLLRKRSSGTGRLAHPLAYELGLGAVYFLFGVVAAVTGGSFNEVLRLPQANLAIGVVLLGLGLASAGMLSFPVLGTDRSFGGAGLGGTFLLGMGAGLLSSACVGPVVVSILLALAANAGSITAVVALTAAIKMGLFGLGLGLPLLAIGLFGVSLPKSGAWMAYVQGTFGLLIAWFATGYLFKGLAGLGFSDGASWTLLLGGLLVFLAVYLGQDGERPAEQRGRFAALALSGAVGFFAMGRALLGSPGTAVEATAVASRSPERSERVGDLVWHLDKAAAYAEATDSGKPVFVDFHGDWCTNCKAFAAQTQSDPKLHEALGRAVLLRVRDSTRLFDEYRSDLRFPELKVGLPFFVITDAKGSLLYKTSDYTKANEMELFLTD